MQRRSFISSCKIKTQHHEGYIGGFLEFNDGALMDKQTKISLLFKSKLTLIASVQFWFTDEGRTVHLVATKENIGWVGIAATDVT